VCADLDAQSAIGLASHRIERCEVLGEGLRQCHRPAGIGRVAIGADRSGKRFGDGGAADEDFDLAAEAKVLDGLDAGSHVLHRGGEQGRQADE